MKSTEKVTKAKQGTILIVDDQEMVRSMIADLLGGLNYRVFTAKDGLDAVQTYKKVMSRSKKNVSEEEGIDLIILDMILPRMDGKETYCKLKEIDPEVKVILSSGYDIDQKIKEVLNQGAVDFIQKPYHIETLLNKVRKHIG